MIKGDKERKYVVVVVMMMLLIFLLLYVAPLESRMSRDMCNTSRDIAAPYATGSNSRAP